MASKEDIEDIKEAEFHIESAERTLKRAHENLMFWNDRMDKLTKRHYRPFKKRK